MSTEAEKTARSRAKSQIERIISSVQPLKVDIKNAITDPNVQSQIDVRLEALLISLQDMRRNIEYQIQMDIDREAEEFNADLPIESE